MEEKKYAVNQPEFYAGLFLLFLIVATLNYFFPAAIPFDLFQFFHFNWDWEALKNIPWTLLLVGPGLNVFAAIFGKNDHRQNVMTRATFIEDIIVSIKAGIFEEASYRWLVFYLLILTLGLQAVLLTWLTSIGWIAAIMSLHWFAILMILVGLNVVGIIGLALINADNCLAQLIGIVTVIFVGALDLAVILLITKWWYTVLIIPIVNAITLGHLSSQLFGFSWVVGAALASSNWRFSEGHAYQGCVGIINSWVMGMLMFWFMFNFGILAAMLVHAVYDIGIHLIRYVSATVRLILIR